MIARGRIDVRSRVGFGPRFDGLLPTVKSAVLADRATEAV